MFVFCILSIAIFISFTSFSNSSTRRWACSASSPFPFATSSASLTFRFHSFTSSSKLFFKSDTSASSLDMCSSRSTILSSACCRRSRSEASSRSASSLIEAFCCCNNSVSADKRSENDFSLTKRLFCKSFTSFCNLSTSAAKFSCATSRSTS